MAVVSEPRILMLDEPTSGVSAEEKFDLMDVVMNALREDNVTVERSQDGRRAATTQQQRQPALTLANVPYFCP